MPPSTRSLPPASRAVLLHLLLVCAALVVLYGLRLDPVLSAVLDLDATDVGAMRAAFVGYVLYGAGLICLVLFALHLVAESAASRLRGMRRDPTRVDPGSGAGDPRRVVRASTLPVVLVATALPVLAFLDTTVFKDYGIHFYEYDVGSVFSDATSARDLGIRTQDVVFALGVAGVLVVGQLALFALLGRWVRRLPRQVGAWALGALVALTVGGGATFAVAGDRVVTDPHEFRATLPLRALLVPGAVERPHLAVRPRLGPGGYPLLPPTEGSTASRGVRGRGDGGPAAPSGTGPRRASLAPLGGDARVSGAPGATGAPAAEVSGEPTAAGDAAEGWAVPGEVPGESGVPFIEDRRNVVVFMGDGLRADHVSEAAGLTPELLAFGRRPEVVAPRRHYSTSHATETGLFGFVYGLEAFAYHAFLEHEVPPWPLEVLKRNGYVTALVAGTRIIQYPSGQLLDAFDQVIYPPDDDAVLRELEAFVEARREDGRPYLVVAFFYTPHYPYDSVEPANRRHLPAIEEESRSPFQSFDDPDFRLRARNAYRNAVLQADDYFAAVRDLVAPEYEAGRTALVATSDHGTEMWEHGLFGHGRSTFWEEKVRVPMYLGLPGVTFPEGVSRTPEVAAHPDVWPTLLEWLGATPLPPAERWSHGRSLLSTPAAALAERRDVVLAGRYFPWADRVNTVVGPRGKHWFHVQGLDADGRFRVDVSRSTDLLDRPGDVSPDDAGPLIEAFEREFWRFLEPAPGAVGGDGRRDIAGDSGGNGGRDSDGEPAGGAR